ncbi:MAG: hypothetical protein GKR99_14315 [Rhodobacteraceae bacterium]|nr:hypothetical protein [Paracoccaceae bacterium]
MIQSQPSGPGSPARIKRILRTFRRKQDGSATIEAILWLPLFMVVFTMVADVSLIFSGQAQMRRIVQDSNRAFAISTIETTQDLETAITNSLSVLSANVSVSASESGGIVTTTATIPASDLDAVGFMAALVNANVVVRSQHLVEG